MSKIPKIRKVREFFSLPTSIKSISRVIPVDFEGGFGRLTFSQPSAMVPPLKIAGTDTVTAIHPNAWAEAPRQSEPVVCFH